MDYWLSKLEEILRIDRENALPKLTKAPFGSFGSAVAVGENAVKPSEEPRDSQKAPQSVLSRTPYNEALNPVTGQDPDIIIEASNPPISPGQELPAGYMIKNCWSCRRALWWRDRLGNKKCGICHPPSNPDQVGWYDDEGEHFEERAAILEYEAGLPRDLAEAQARTNETDP